MRVANAEAAQQAAEAERDTLMQEAARLQEQLDQQSQVLCASDPYRLASDSHQACMSC